MRELGRHSCSRIGINFLDLKHLTSLPGRSEDWKWWFLELSGKLDGRTFAHRGDACMCGYRIPETRADSPWICVSLRVLLFLSKGIEVSVRSVYSSTPRMWLRQRSPLPTEIGCAVATSTLPASYVDYRRCSVIPEGAATEIFSQIKMLHGNEVK